MILYRLKIIIYKQHLVQGLVGIIKKFFGNQSSQDIHAVKLIKKYVRKKTFIDIGCMWGINGDFCFHAEECGAKRIMGLDVYPECEEFISKKRERNSKVEFLQGDINSQDTIDKIGLYDVVFCSGVLYHSPAPEYLLSRLRLICGETLIFI